MPSCVVEVIDKAINWSHSIAVMLLLRGRVIFDNHENHRNFVINFRYWTSCATSHFAFDSFVNHFKLRATFQKSRENFSLFYRDFNIPITNKFTSLQNNIDIVLIPTISLDQTTLSSPFRFRKIVLFSLEQIAFSVTTDLEKPQENFCLLLLLNGPNKIHSNFREASERFKLSATWLFIGYCVKKSRWRKLKNSI